MQCLQIGKFSPRKKKLFEFFFFFHESCDAPKKLQFKEIFFIEINDFISKQFCQCKSPSKLVFFRFYILILCHCVVFQLNTQYTYRWMNNIKEQPKFKSQFTTIDFIGLFFKFFLVAVGNGIHWNLEFTVQFRPMNIGLCHCSN